MNVSPDMLDGKYDYIVTGGALTEPDPLGKVNAIKIGMEALAQTSQALRMNGEKVNFKPLLEKLLRELDIKAIDEVIMPLTDQEKAMQEMQMMGTPRGQGKLPPSRF